MVTDFNPIVYAPYVVRGFGNRQVGIPTFAY